MSISGVRSATMIMFRACGSWTGRPGQKAGGARGQGPSRSPRRPAVRRLATLFVGRRRHRADSAGRVTCRPPLARGGDSRRPWWPRSAGHPRWSHPGGMEPWRGGRRPRSDAVTGRRATPAGPAIVRGPRGTGQSAPPVAVPRDAHTLKPGPSARRPAGRCPVARPPVAGGQAGFTRSDAAREHGLVEQALNRGAPRGRVPP